MSQEEECEINMIAEGRGTVNLNISGRLGDTDGVKWELKWLAL